MTKRLFHAVAAASMLTSAILTSSCTGAKDPFAQLVEDELGFAAQQTMLMYDSVRDRENQLVNTARNGELVTCPSWDWVAGFFPGTLWYMYEYTRNPEFFEAAAAMTERMAPEQFNTSNHDVGFMISCSYGNGLRLTGSQEYRDVMVNAANSLSTRFNPAVGCTRSWNPRESRGWDFVVIVDNMMNLELLARGTELTGDQKFIEMAKTHANTTMKNHYRPDYSSFHVVNYSDETGEILSKETEQGYSDSSAWARGQAWGFYGYTMMYRETGDEAYLEQALRIGDFLTNHPNLPADRIFYWDFDAPVDENTPRDASAAAIMASACVELSTLVKSTDLSEKYFNFAKDIITSLSQAPYRAELGENSNFILMHSTCNLPKGNFDTPVVYADYYYIEALMRIKKLIENK